MPLQTVSKFGKKMACTSLEFCNEDGEVVMNSLLVNTCREQMGKLNAGNINNIWTFITEITEVNTVTYGIGVKIVQGLGLIVISHVSRIDLLIVLMLSPTSLYVCKCGEVKQSPAQMLHVSQQVNPLTVIELDLQMNLLIQI